MTTRMAEAVPSAPRPLPFELDYVAPADLEAVVRRQSDKAVLAEIHFGTAARDLTDAPHPHAVVDMPQLGPSPLVELWRSRLPVSYHRSGDIVYARNSEILLGCLTDDATTAPTFDTVIRGAYDAMLRLIEAEGYPHFLRMWNHFPDIGGVVDGLDRYQHFCHARFQALEDHYGEFSRKLPAASAVGSRAGPLVIYFMAARTPGRHRENPRQMSAYRYPPQYGPRSPSFARATLKRWGQAHYLYISGTASIVGHASRHSGDASAQLDETLRNLAAVIDTTAADEGVDFRGLDSLTHIKVFIRDPAHTALVRARLDATLRPDVRRIFLQAEICRGDLLLEIEGVAAAPA